MTSASGDGATDLPETLPKIQLPGGVLFSPATYLAPMEGVTDPSFRDLILKHNPGGVGAICTQFLRVSQTPLHVERIRSEIGNETSSGVPTGVQLMGNEPNVVAESAIRAAEAGAAFVDLNFGCPAAKVFQHRAGSALLDEPELLAKLVEGAVKACPVPVTAKIRSGVADDRKLEDLAKIVEQAGAVLLTVHARLKIQSYREAPVWSRIERAVHSVNIPVIGNGSANTPEDMEAMFEQTGCAGVMVGRAAIGNPWIFSDWLRFKGRESNKESVPSNSISIHHWLLEYERGMIAGGALASQALGKLKQALKAMIDSGKLPSNFRQSALRAQSRDEFHKILAAYFN